MTPRFRMFVSNLHSEARRQDGAIVCDDLGTHEAGARAGSGIVLVNSRWQHVLETKQRSPRTATCKRGDRA